MAQWHSAALATSVSVADTLASTWTAQANPIGPANAYQWVWTAPANGSGANTVTVTATGGTSTHMTVIELSNNTVCVADATANASTSFASNAVALPSVTTTFYRDVILDFVQTNFGGGMSPTFNAAYTAVALSHSTTGQPTYIQMRYSGDPGVIAGPTISNGSASGTASEFVLALKSTTNLTVSTTAIPNAVSGTAYSFQLQATGGTGTNVWSTTAGSLPCGLSLASSGVISGTPTCSNPNTITFQVADAGAHTATKNLTITVGTATSTIVRLQEKDNTSGVTIVFVSNVASGSLIVYGISSTNNYDICTATDTRGTIYTEIPGAVMADAATINRYVKMYWGFTTSAGANTITPVCGGFGAIAWASEWSNVQQIFDTGVVAKLNSTGGGATITSGTLTAPIAETLYGSAYIATSTGTLAPNAPYSQDSNLSGGSTLINSGYQIGASSGANTASWAVTNNTSNNWAIMLWGFRPTTTGTAPLGGGNRKKGTF